MSTTNRRKFFEKTAAGAAGLTLGASLVSSPWSRALGANDEIRMAVAGLNNRGNGHIGRFHGMKGVSVVALCDPDSKVLDKRMAEFKKKHSPKDVKGYTDIRKILERDDIDAIVIATPNHWHSLMTVWACQAGKHVYVEKPVSHTIWEGRKMVEAARKYDRIVQAGTQHRSCPAVQEAARDMAAGRWGKVQWVHCARLGKRESIGLVTEPQPVPSHIDYNLWAGPAPMTPVMRKQFHYDWHWQWNWGSGEMGNWGIHYLDDVRHILGWDSVPTSVQAAGNRYAWNDNGETPNMHFGLFDYDGVPLVVDVRNLPDPKGKGGKSGAVYLKRRSGNYIQCEKASIQIARGGGGAYDADGKRVHQYKGDGGSAHAKNFIDALRSGKREDLNADIEVCHLSTALCHQANIGFRVGQTASVDQVSEAMKVHDDALNTLNDIVRQVEGNGVDIAKQPLIMGPKLTYDRKSEQFIGRDAKQANAYLKGTYRKGFEIPEKV